VSRSPASLAISAASDERFRRALSVIVPAWFVTVSVIRLSVLLPTTPGYDGMLYRDATLRWLSGGDPWAPIPGQAVFGAPPPTLLAMLPFAILPETIARIALVGLGIVASLWMIRKLRLPLWWIAFPPLVDGLYIANPHVFVVPLLIAGAAPLAVFVKAYAGVVPLILGQWRALLVTAALVVVTIPILPWGLFLQRWPEVSAALQAQSGGGGLSVLATPILVPVALLAAVFIGRRRLAWWAVPVFWPFTQWYYASMALPVVTPLAAIALASPVQGATTVAIVLAVVESRWLVRERGLLRPAADLGTEAASV